MRGTRRGRCIGHEGCPLAHALAGSLFALLFCHARPALPPTSSGRLRSRPSASNGARCSTSSAPRSTPSRRSPPDFTFSEPAPRAGVGSALDAGAGATQRDHLADLRRHRTQPGAGAVAVRHRALSRSAARTARPTACRCRAIRPISARSTCSTPAPPATTRCSRSSPAPATACRRGPSPGRSRCRSPARS